MTISELAAAARDAQKNAYAPYSGFKVGAAVLTGSGNVFAGANVENASFGLTICAERAAVAAAIGAGDTDLRVIAIATDGNEPTVPCGACRQVLAEFNQSLEIVALTSSGKKQHFDLGELLPRVNQGITVKHV